jgi:hypothetical protein
MIKQAVNEGKTVAQIIDEYAHHAEEEESEDYLNF